MKDFRTLKVWEKSHQFTLKIYSLSRNFPKDELFGLISQICRASSSIAVNIAEGCGRGSDADFARFLQISMGSASETEYLIMLCADLEYIPNDSKETLLLEVQELKMMLASLIKTIRK